jgi:hypothetical protein
MPLCATTIVFGIVALSRACAEDTSTTAPKGNYRIIQRITDAPQRTYRIVQRHSADAWDAVLQFRDPAFTDAPLATEPDRYPWSADYHISSDDQWILRIQKTGSGENTAFLYRVDQNGRVWRMAQRLDAMAFALLTKREHLTPSDYYHTGVEFLGWELAARSLRFRLHGTAEDTAKPQLDKRFVYHLDSHTLTE